MPRIVSRPSSSMMSSRSTFESRHASSSNSAMTSPIPSTLSSQNCHSNTVSRVSTVEKCYQPSNDSCGTVLLGDYAFHTQVCMYPLVGPEDNDGISVRIDEQSISLTGNVSIANFGLYCVLPMHDSNASHSSSSFPCFAC